MRKGMFYTTASLKSLMCQKVTDTSKALHDHFDLPDDVEVYGWVEAEHCPWADEQDGWFVRVRGTNKKLPIVKEGEEIPRISLSGLSRG